MVTASYCFHTLDRLQHFLLCFSKQVLLRFDPNAFQKVSIFIQKDSMNSRKKSYLRHRHNYPICQHDFLPFAHHVNLHPVYKD